MAKKKVEKPTIPKDDFIEFISSMTPAEINKLIEEKGKPHRLMEPLFFFPRK